MSTFYVITLWILDCVHVCAFLFVNQELKCVSAEKRLVLDTVNEVGSALLDLVPWRAREGLDRLVADANQRYRQADETITQRVQLVQAAIQRSQQVLYFFSVRKYHSQCVLHVHYCYLSAFLMVCFV